MSAAVILVVGLGGVLALPLAWRAATRRFDPFEPLVLFTIAYGVMFVARPAAMLANDDFFYGVDVRATFPLAMVLAFLGGVAFLVGYHLRAGPALADRFPSPREISTRSVLVASVGLTVLAGIALLAITVGDVTRSSYVTYGARLLVPASVCLVAVAIRDRSARLAIPAGCLAVATLALLVPAGSRIFLLPLLGGVFVFIYVYRRRRPSAILCVALAAISLFASYAAVIVREPERRVDAREQFEALLYRPYRVFDLLLYRGDAEMAPVLAGALTAVPDELGYRYGRATVGEFVLRPIPRQLWQGKPEPSRKQVVEAVWPNLASHFSPVFSPLLSFYWDFGIAGVFAGMALIGIACRTLYAWFLRYADRFAAQLIFSVALWYVVVAARDDVIDTFVLASFVVLPIVLIERFGQRPGVLTRPMLTRTRA